MCGCRGKGITLCNCFMKFEASLCFILGHVVSITLGYLGVDETFTHPSGVRVSRSPYTGLLTLGRAAPSNRPPGSAISARSGRPIPRWRVPDTRT